MAAETPKFFVHTLTVPVAGPKPDEKITELKVRTDIRARDLASTDAAKGEVAKGIRLLAKLAELPPSTIDDLSATDFSAIMEKLGPFVPGGLKTQTTSLET